MMEQQIKEGLQEIAERHIGDERDVWPALQTKVAPKIPSQPRSRWRKTRRGWALSALAILLLVVTAVYAVAPALQSLFDMDSGAEGCSFVWPGICAQPEPGRQWRGHHPGVGLRR